MQSEEELRAKARQRAEQKVGFHAHLAAYILVNALLIVVWWFTGGGFPWFVLVLVFWGIGLLAHGLPIARKSLFLFNQGGIDFRQPWGDLRFDGP